MICSSNRSNTLCLCSIEAIITLKFGILGVSLHFVSWLALLCSSDSVSRTVYIRTHTYKLLDLAGPPHI